MGMFSKAKKGMTDSVTAGQQADDFSAQQQAGRDAGQIGVQGMGPIAADPALVGGPSTKPLDAEDPLLQPVNGMSLEMYGGIAKEAGARGITDEAGMVTLAGELHGIPPADAQAAFATWVERRSSASSSASTWATDRARERQGITI